VTSKVKSSVVILSARNDLIALISVKLKGKLRSFSVSVSLDHSSNRFPGLYS
jgi:hypothetical protein